MASAGGYWTKGKFHPAEGTLEASVSVDTPKHRRPGYRRPDRASLSHSEYDSGFRDLSPLSLIVLRASSLFYPIP